MGKIKRFLSRLSISEKVLFIILLGILVAAFIPVYRLALYSCPYYDDYSYGFYVKNFYEQEGPASIFKAVVMTVKGFWYAWQGTYASAAMMSLAGMSFGEEYYFVGIWAVITVISLGTFTLFYTLSRKVLNASGYSAASLGILGILLLTEFIYSSYVGVFWYNSAVHYTFMHGVMFFMISAAVSIMFAKGTVSRVLWAIMTMVLGVVCAGANFVTCLQGALILCVICTAAFIWRKAAGFYYLPAIALYSMGLFENLSAPGNDVRQAHFAGEPAVKAIIDSFIEAFKRIPEFTSLSSLVVVAAMLPLIINMVRKMKVSFKLPGVVTALAFCLYATGYTSSFYSWAGPPVERTLVCVKFTYQILLVLTVTYWTGYFTKRLEKQEINLRYNLSYYALLAALICIFFVFSKDRAGGYLSYGSYYYVHDCEAQSFRQEHLERIEIIKNSDGGDVAVPKHMHMPWLLTGPNDLSTSATAEQNSFMARYYGVDSIYVDLDYKD